jgi:hypothetical protein
MRASDAVRELQALIAAHGDLDLAVRTADDRAFPVTELRLTNLADVSPPPRTSLSDPCIIVENMAGTVWP